MRRLDRRRVLAAIAACTGAGAAGAVAGAPARSCEAVVFTNATTDEGEPKLELPAAETEISGDSTCEEGATLELQLQSRSDSSPFLLAPEATVGADGRWSASVDFSNRAETSFEVTVERDFDTISQTVPGEIVEDPPPAPTPTDISESTPTPTATPAPTETPTPTATPTPEGFRPSVHGFGFENYSGPSGAPGPGELYDVVTSTWASSFAWESVLSERPSDAFFAALAGGLYALYEAGVLQSAHCLGMSLAAREYYFDGLPELPAGYVSDHGVQTAGDIGEVPTDVDALEPVERDIDRRQNGQLLDLGFVLMTQLAAVTPDTGRGAIDYAGHREAIKSDIDAGRLPGVHLSETADDIFDQDYSAHLVLAYDYDGNDIHVYDPNHKFEEQTVTIDDGGLETYDGYTRMAYVPESPEVGLSLFEGGAAGAIEVLRENLGDFVTFGVMSPVSVTVRDPDGETLPTVPVPEERLHSETGYESLAYQFGATPGEYEVAVDGEADGEYTVEMTRSGDSGQVTESVTASITSGERQTLAATVPGDSASDPTLERASGGESTSTARSTESTPTDRQFDPTTADEATTSESGPGFGALGALAGVGLGYLRALGRSDSEE